MDTSNEKASAPSGAAEPPGPEKRSPRPHNRWLIFALLILIAGAIGVGVWQMWPEPKEKLPHKAFYTVDDGATLFADDPERLPPFDHNGKPAVRAKVFSCDGGKTRFVGYLEKLPEEALQKIVAEGKDLRTVDDDDIAAESGWMIKRPGDAEWANSKRDKARYDEIRQVKCPEGKTLAPVYPE